MEKKEYYFHAKGLKVGYKKKPLIENIEIPLKKGEILTLLGPNGAGKTTIIKSIIQQLEPLGGVMYLDGEDMFAMNRKTLAKRMSAVLTNPIDTEFMTVEDVVGTGRYPYTGKFGILEKEDKRVLKESMELVHIVDIAQKQFSEISDGQRQRVLLARALCQEPDLLILDEPTSYLDIRYKMEFLSVLQELSRQKQVTVILSLHELELAARVSDHIICVNQEGVKGFGTPEEIFSEGFISTLYGIKVGNYDEKSGDLELEAKKGKPEIFILAGNGTGSALFRKMQRKRIPFAVGVLWENDLDYPVAKALASEIITVPAFCRISEKKIEQAKQCMKRCGRVVTTLELSILQDYGSTLRELYDFALQNQLVEEK